MMELLIRTKWNKDVETIMYLVTLDGISHDNSALLCMTEKQTESGYVASDYDAHTRIRTYYFLSFGVHRGLCSIKIILKFVHLRAKTQENSRVALTACR